MSVGQDIFPALLPDTVLHGRIGDIEGIRLCLIRRTDTAVLLQQTLFTAYSRSALLPAHLIFQTYGIGYLYPVLFQLLDQTAQR